jgi:hypothetical protein
MSGEYSDSSCPSVRSVSKFGTGSSSSPDTSGGGSAGTEQPTGSTTSGPSALDSGIWQRDTIATLSEEGGEVVVIFSQIWSDNPMHCGRTGCPNWVQDRQQAVFVVSKGATMPFCCQACFAQACQEQVRRHQLQAPKDPLERLGYGPPETYP